MLRKSILGKHFFFYWAIEWALKYHGPTGLVEPTRPGGGGFEPRKKKICLVNGPGLSRGSWPAGQGSDMEILGSNPTRCHSYLGKVVVKTLKTMDENLKWKSESGERNEK